MLLVINKQGVIESDDYHYLMYFKVHVRTIDKILDMTIEDEDKQIIMEIKNKEYKSYFSFSRIPEYKYYMGKLSDFSSKNNSFFTNKNLYPVINLQAVFDFYPQDVGTNIISFILF